MRTLGSLGPNHCHSKSFLQTMLSDVYLLLIAAIAIACCNVISVVDRQRFRGVSERLTRVWTQPQKADVGLRKSSS